MTPSPTIAPSNLSDPDNRCITCGDVGVVTHLHGDGSVVKTPCAACTVFGVGASACGWEPGDDINPEIVRKAAKAVQEIERMKRVSSEAMGMVIDR